MAKQNSITSVDGYYLSVNQLKALATKLRANAEVRKRHAETVQKGKTYDDPLATKLDTWIESSNADMLNMLASMIDEVLEDK